MNSPPYSIAFCPAYLNLTWAELQERGLRATVSLEVFRDCPRDWGVNRLEDKWAVYKTSRYALTGSYSPHFGEEDCLRGCNGSGTIFFSHCKFHCVFCQNYEISQAVKPGRSAPGCLPNEVARMIVKLRRLGCHNIHFATPEYVVHQVVEAQVEAIDGRLCLPIVCNTSAYDSFESLEFLDGIVDIYMPDFKCWPDSYNTTMLSMGKS